MKNTPACSRNWKKNISSPPVSCGTASSAGSTRGSLPLRMSRCCHTKNSHTTNRPITISQNVGEMPNQAAPPGLGVIHPHSLERSTPNTAVPRPSTDSRVLVRSRR